MCWIALRDEIRGYSILTVDEHAQYVLGKITSTTTMITVNTQELGYTYLPVTNIAAILSDNPYENTGKTIKLG